MIIITEEKQDAIDRLRIDLAQAAIDLAAVHTTDIHSRQIKERVSEGLRKVRQGLDIIGVMHSSIRRRPNGGAVTG